MPFPVELLRFFEQATPKAAEARSEALGAFAPSQDEGTGVMAAANGDSAA
jgi:hypothetical protein